MSRFLGVFSGVWRACTARVLAVVKSFWKALPSAGAASTAVTGPPGSVVATAGLEVVLHGLSAAELNGRKATITSSAPKQNGRWEVSVPQDSGEPRIVALKLNNLMWAGRQVQLGNDVPIPEFAGAYGLTLGAVSGEDGKWTVVARKIANLKPANMELCSPEASRIIQQGSRFVAQSLQSAPSLNGLEGVVKSTSLNENGRWEVALLKKIDVPLQSLKMVWASEIFGEMLQTKHGPKRTDDVLADKKAVLLYFSAHWCPPCRGFTPVLADVYKKYVPKDVEVIFVSSDRDAGSFESYYSEMPWVALPFADRSRQSALSSRYGVQGIPMLVALRGADGTVAAANARGEVQGMGDFAKCLPAWGC